MTTMKTDKPHIISKLNLWFQFYIDDCNPKTYLNKTEAAIAAGYNCRAKNPYQCFCVIGAQNYSKLKDRVSKWLDDTGLSESALKQKLCDLMSVREKRFFSAPIKDSEGMVTGIHIEDIEVDAIETQRKTLDMALKVKDMIAPTRHELANRKGEKLLVEHSLDETWRDLLLSVTGDNENDLPTAENQ